MGFLEMPDGTSSRDNEPNWSHDFEQSSTFTAEIVRAQQLHFMPVLNVASAEVWVALRF